MDQLLQVRNLIKISTKLLLTVLLLFCLMDMPYGYYQFVRFIGMTIFILLAYFDSIRQDKMLMIVWICSAILINPIFKIALGRTIWNIVDVIWAMVLVLTIVSDLNIIRGKRNIK